MAILFEEQNKAEVLTVKMCLFIAGSKHLLRAVRMKGVPIRSQTSIIADTFLYTNMYICVSLCQNIISIDMYVSSPTPNLLRYNPGVCIELYCKKRSFKGVRH